MAVRRNNRLTGEFKKLISDIIRRDVKDPRISEMLSITDVVITEDLKTAKVYVSIYGEGENAEKLALCHKIYNRLVETAKSDFETKAEEFEEKYPVIWYMLDEYYIHEAKNHNDLAKIAALLGAI